MLKGCCRTGGLKVEELAVWDKKQGGALEEVRGGTPDGRGNAAPRRSRIDGSFRDGKYADQEHGTAISRSLEQHISEENGKSRASHRDAREVLSYLQVDRAYYRGR